ncbi:MAG: hypothetical protein J5643_02840 [Lachnospiraceae bacterium]|nr:hypothetical protein [Lachnospiraceae bacterium]
MKKVKGFIFLIFAAVLLLTSVAFAKTGCFYDKYSQRYNVSFSVTENKVLGITTSCTAYGTVSKAFEDTKYRVIVQIWKGTDGYVYTFPSGAAYADGYSIASTSKSGISKGKGCTFAYQTGWHRLADAWYVRWDGKNFTSPYFHVRPY